jgi:hypothetical protein
METGSDQLSQETLYVAHPQGKLHIRLCPHLQDTSDPAEATSEQRRDNEVCSWCSRELAGEGRTYFDTLDEALHEFGHRSDEAQRLIRAALSGVEHDLVWIPASRSYIALGLSGPAVAWIGWGYVAVKGRPVEELPWFQPNSGGGNLRPEEARGALCEVHFVERSVTGACEMCE